MRIGLVGTDSSHAEQFLHLLNRDNRYPGSRVPAVAAGMQKRMTELSQIYDIAVAYDDPAQMAGHVDAVIVGARDGALHLPHARPFLEAGLPVLIDKPLALTMADAESLCDLAAQSGALLTSASALRWQPAMAGFRSVGLGASKPLSLKVTGTFYPQSEYGGTFFYGVHSAEMALELAGVGFSNVVVSRHDERTVHVRYEADGADVLLCLVTPEPGADSWFGVDISGDGVAAGGQVSLPDDYMAPVLERFMTMIATGMPPLSREQLLAPVALLTAIDTQLRAL